MPSCERTASESSVVVAPGLPWWVMSQVRSVVRRTLVMGGVDLRRARVTARLLPTYLRQYRTFRAATGRAGRDAVALGDPFPITADRGAAAGDAVSDYFLQDLWAARRIFEAGPASHLDIGSRVDGFVSHLLVFRDVEVIDIRPLVSTVAGLTFRQEDATSLTSVATDSIESLSSLHAVEHFGLGRYGDALDPAACFTAMSSFARVLAPGGRLYFSVPIGRERVEFNAHRILDPVRVLDALMPLELVAFSVISADGTVIHDARPTDFRGQPDATGLYEFTKSGSGAPGDRPSSTIA
jgi:hypothetical protein